MTIINHGAWTRYHRDTMPKAFCAEEVEGVTTPTALGMNIMFCKRQDGVDWYDFIYTEKTFAEGSIKMTVGNDGIVRAATRDASMLFPQDCEVVEVIGDDASDPQTKYGGKLYDARTNHFSDPPPPPPPVDPIADLLKRIEALEAK